jgi:hypothetical protein
MRAFCSALAFALLVFSMVGCGPGRGDVSGKVTYQGKPLVFGTVQFETKEGIKQSNIKEDGTYTIPRVVAGEIKAAVNSPNPNSSDHQAIMREGQEPPPPRTPIKGWFAIPAEYQNLSSAKLSYTVNTGQNKFDIELK